MRSTRSPAARCTTWLQEVWTADGRTVLLVTHDVEEALVLADRVIVMSPRPGRIVVDEAVAFPRRVQTRLITDPAFVAAKRSLLDALGHVVSAGVARIPNAVIAGAEELARRDKVLKRALQRPRRPRPAGGAVAGSRTSPSWPA